ncbi:hypothetical protein HJ590_00305 [Naumannella sp. ID2617S]|nr:hypothetical protein [Naumannella sp. ID2617S]
MSWTGSGTSFKVTVGGKSQTVAGGQRSATLTGFSPGSYQVTVTAGSSSKSTSVTVPRQQATQNPTTKPPTTTQAPAKPPAQPTGLSGTHSGTSARVSFNKVAGATKYEIYCNDVGSKVITGTSGTVTCGASSAGKPVKVGVRAINSAGASGVAQVYAKGT